MRELVLYPGESITIGDTVIRSDFRRGKQFVNPHAHDPYLWLWPPTKAKPGDTPVVTTGASKNILDAASKDTK